MKSEKGALVLYVSVACLFLLIVGITAYIGVSNKQAGQIAKLKRIEQNYNNSNVTAEELYKSYDGGDVIPIYTPEQFAKVGSGEEVYVKETGKFYTFSIDKTYMFYGVPEDLTNLLNKLKQEIKNEVKVEIGAGTDQGTVTSGILKLTRSTNQLVNSLTITATAESKNGIRTYVDANREEKIYNGGTKSIEESFTVTQNGNYVFSVVEENGEISDATMVITNIVSDIIDMTPSTTNWTNKDVTLTINWPNGSEKGVKEIQIDNGNWTRYTGLKTTLTISENCTVKARVTNGINEMKTNSITITNIERTNPIVTATTGTDVFEEYTTKQLGEYFTYQSNGNAPISKIEYFLNGKSITNTTMILPGNYTIICKVTKANGNYSTAEKNITVTALELAISSEAVNWNEGNRKPISDYFVFNANAPCISSVEYTCNGETINNGSVIPLGGEIKCTINKRNNTVVSKTQNIQYLSGGNATEIANNAEIYYGRIVTNYITPGGDKDTAWQIYYADKESDTIYLISAKNVDNTSIPQNKGAYSIDKFKNDAINFSSIYQAYTGSASITDARVKKLISWVSSYPSSTNTNIRSIAYLLDTDLWNEQYKDSTYGAYAIGGPTIELFYKSLKDSHPNAEFEYRMETNGYDVNGNYIESVRNDLEKIGCDEGMKMMYYVLYTGFNKSVGGFNAYWLASPSADDGVRLLGVGAFFDQDVSSGVDSANYDDTGLGVRPVVCLQSGVQLVSNGDGTYKLSK